MHVVAIYAAKQTGKKVQVRLMLSSARAGFPSPADDHVEKQLDLNDHLIGDKAATFIVRAKGRQTRRRPRLVSACPTPPLPPKDSLGF